MRHFKCKEFKMQRTQLKCQKCSFVTDDIEVNDGEKAGKFQILFIQSQLGKKDFLSWWYADEKKNKRKKITNLSGAIEMSSLG